MTALSDLAQQAAIRLRQEPLRGANAGDFAGAQAAAEQAMALADAAGDRGQMAKFQAQREEYRAGRPWRE